MVVVVVVVKKVDRRGREADELAGSGGRPWKKGMGRSRFPLFFPLFFSVARVFFSRDRPRRRTKRSLQCAACRLVEAVDTHSPFPSTVFQCIVALAIPSCPEKVRAHDKRKVQSKGDLLCRYRHDLEKSHPINDKSKINQGCRSSIGWLQA